MIEDGYSQSEISWMTGIPQPTISNWSKKYRMTRTVNRKKGSGRMKIINDRTSNRIIRWITSGKCNNCVNVQCLTEIFDNN